jgi:hypothetical protein
VYWWVRRSFSVLKVFVGHLEHVMGFGVFSVEGRLGGI